MILNNRHLRSLALICIIPVVGLIAVSCGKNDQPAQISSDNSLLAVDGSAPVANKIPAGVSINGIDVSALSVDEARVKVQTALSTAPNVSLPLQYNGQSWTLTGAELGIAYDIEPALQQAAQAAQTAAAQEADGTVVQVQQALALTAPMTLSPTALDTALLNITAQVNQEAKDASAEFTPEKSERFTYTTGQTGIQVDVAATSQAIQAAFNGASPTPFAAPVALVVTTVEPQHTVEDVKQNTKRIASFSTSYKGNDHAGRIHNLKLGVEKIHGVTVKPGSTFSFNKTTGERSEKNGWKEAATIINGNTFEDNFGGGICQISTTLYVAVVKSGLKINERTHHSFPSTYVPKGLDATVNYPDKDLRFTNNTDYPIYITSTIDTNGKEVAVAIWGRPLPDEEYIKMRSEVIKEIEPEEAEKVENYELRADGTEKIIKSRKGYEVEVYKDTYGADGKVIDSKKLYTDHYPAVRGVVAVGAGGLSSVNSDIIPEEGSSDTSSKKTDSTSSSDNIPESNDTDSSTDSDNSDNSDSFDIPEEFE